jgi:AcrR family transcriptional regulator
MTEIRIPLTRERVLQKALELADAGGLEKLTMRKLARELGYEAMSLYNHVANKDDLIDGILGLVLAEMEPPSVDEDWAETIRRSAISIYRALRAHSWAASVLMSPGHVHAARLELMETLLARLRTAGFTADTTYHAYHLLDAYIFGFSLWHTSHTYTPEQAQSMMEWAAREITADVYPYLREHAEQHMDDGPHQEVSAFELGLDMLLAGIERLRDGG